MKIKIRSHQIKLDPFQQLRQKRKPRRARGADGKDKSKPSTPEETNANAPEESEVHPHSNADDEGKDLQDAEVDMDQGQPPEPVKEPAKEMGTRRESGERPDSDEDTEDEFGPYDGGLSEADLELPYAMAAQTLNNSIIDNLGAFIDVDTEMGS